MLIATEAGDVCVARTNVPDGVGSNGEEVIVMARPEALSISSEPVADSAAINVWSGVLRAEMFRGSHSEFLVEVAGRMVRVRNTQTQMMPSEGSTVFVAASSDALCVLPQLHQLNGRLA
jgi:hypothetical protein